MEESGFDEAAWREELLGHRETKDDFFAEHPQSPVPPAARDDFEGLSYFDPDPSFRVEATVEKHDEPEPVEMETTEGPPQRYLRVATLHFEIDADGQEGESEADGREGGNDESYSLAAYRQEGGEGLFVPFRDKTTGQQTYEGGRYMEFETDGELSDGETIPLDFNLAYTPFCAFSETFSCPLPPEENWLDAMIAAGEKGRE